MKCVRAFCFLLATFGIRAMVIAQTPQPAADPGSGSGAQAAASQSGPDSTAQPEGSVRVSGGVIAGLRLSGKLPIYPSYANVVGISGTVVMRATIGKDGTVHNFQMGSGNEMLAKSAVDAVKTWTYKPYLLNGKPSAVDTTITVNFFLKGSHPPGGWTPSRVRISSGVIAQLKVSGNNPVYPAEARAQQISGSVVLHAIIGTNGHVQSLDVVSGDPLLTNATLDAVRTWVYKQYLIDGRPAEIDTTITVNFNAAPPLPPGRVRVSSGVMNGLKISGPGPVYPADVEVSGPVVLRVVIGKDGTVQSADVVSGPPAMQPYALAAVKQWKYKPYLLNGDPMEVETTITMIVDRDAPPLL